jgi:site-specific DNA-methyltransferase (adenine-specific)
MMEINKIYNEDCLDTMNRMPDNFVDCILTSPPYNISKKTSKQFNSNISAHSRYRSGNFYDEYKDTLTEKEYLEFTIKVFNKYNKVLKKGGCVLYNMSYNKSNSNLMNLTVAEIIKKTNFNIQDVLIWKKPHSIPSPLGNKRLRRICEFIYIFIKKDGLDEFEINKKVINIENGINVYETIDNFIEAKNNDGCNELNKATFSSELVRKLLRIYNKKDSLIYDSFMGTGTTAKSCIMENMNFLGSELSKKQVDFANKRLVPYLTQTTLF